MQAETSFMSTFEMFPEDAESNPFESSKVDLQRPIIECHMRKLVHRSILSNALKMRTPQSCCTIYTTKPFSSLRLWLTSSLP